jgi:hypothetical protein
MVAESIGGGHLAVNKFRSPKGKQIPKVTDLVPNAKLNGKDLSHLDLKQLKPIRSQFSKRRFIWRTINWC